MLKRLVVLSLITTLFLSLVLFDTPKTYGGKIDYKKYLKMSAGNATREMVREQKGERNWGFQILLMQSGKLL